MSQNKVGCRRAVRNRVTYLAIESSGTGVCAVVEAVDLPDSTSLMSKAVLVDWINLNFVVVGLLADCGVERSLDLGCRGSGRRVKVQRAEAF